MNILFIYSVDDIFSPARALRSPAEIQFGISYISSLLKKQGHATTLLILSRMLGQKNIEMINDRIKRYAPKLICFTGVSTEHRFIADMAKYIKNSYPDAFLMAGGPHVSLNPVDVSRDVFDALCIGEGEYPTLELVSQLEKGLSPSGIPNLWIKQGAGIEKNVPRPFIQDLERLPFPDREMWREWTAKESGPEHAILLGRGCPFHCTYCCNHALKDVAEGPYVRFRSPRSILEEIREITLKFPGQTNMYLEIETIGSNKKWALELCSKLEKFNKTLEKPLSYRTNLRITPKLDLEALFAAFKKSNVLTVNIGVESGSERVRREILKRDYSNRDIVNAVTLARKYGLKVYFYNLIGVPGETLADFKETIRLNRECLPERTFNHIFFPYPGTGLYSVCMKKGLLPEKIDTKLERCKATLDLPGFSKKQIQNGFVWFDYDVYRGRKPLSEILPKVLISKLRSNAGLHFFYRRLSYSPLFKCLKHALMSFKKGC